MGSAIIKRLVDDKGTHPLENLQLEENHQGGDVLSENVERGRKYRKTHHQEDRNCSTQWTISRNRRRGDRMGRSRAFSYSSMGMTSAIQ